jgi:quercetin dioxygenase-like cupin family protein
MLATNHRAGLHGRPRPGPLLTFRLESETNALEVSARYASDGLASKILASQGSLRISLLSLRRGAVLRAHQVEGASSLQVVRGLVRLSTAQDEVVTAADGLVILAARVPHEVTALSDCAMLLTVFKP